MKIVEFLNARNFSILFSGGKDSLATLLWVIDNIRHTNWNIIYVEVTGNTSSICTQYVKNIVYKMGVEEKLIITKREDLDFFDCLKRWGVPIINMRWCLHLFKRKCFQKYGHFIQVIGIKHSDSIYRRKRKAIEFYRKSKSICVSPLLNWDKEEVIDYIKEHGIISNPCYDIYGHSGNCMFCPYHNKKQIILTLQDPFWRRRILENLKYCKGNISRKIYRKWLKLSSQKTLFLNLQV